MANQKKKAVAILSNDHHIGNSTVSEFTENWNEMCEVGKEYGVDKVLLGGDMFLHREAQALPVLLAVRNAILQAGEFADVYAIEGNHDKKNLTSDDGYMRIFDIGDTIMRINDSYYNIVDTHQEIKISSKVSVWLMSYFPETGSAKTKIKEIAEKLDSQKYNIFYGHQGVNGGLAHENATINKELPTSVFDKFDKVLLGHYHNRAVLDGGKIEYIGSSRQFNFGEDEEKGYTILFDDGTTKFVKNKVNFRYQTLEFDAENIKPTVFRKVTKATEDGKVKIRVRVRGEEHLVKKLNKNDFYDAGATKVEFISTTETEKDVKQTSGTEKFSVIQVKDKYVKFAENKDVDPSMGEGYLNI